MLSDTDKNIEKRDFFHAMLIPFIVAVLMFLSFLLEKGMDWKFYSAGVFPRKIENIWGIFTMIFVHADWSHLINNIISFFILSTALYYFYRALATKILLLSYILSGTILWIIGRENWHIGASGLIYALAFFLFTSGILRKYAPLVAISLIVVFLYGNMVWHIFPWQTRDTTSWEGHLSGTLTGVMLALIYRKKGPQKPVKIWEDEEEEETDYYRDVKV